MVQVIAADELTANVASGLPAVHEAQLRRFSHYSSKFVCSFFARPTPRDSGTAAPTKPLNPTRPSSPTSPSARADPSVRPHIKTTSTGEMQSEGKNPAAVALGRLGGLKGGKARAEKLSAQKRSAIAKQGGSGTLGTHPSRKVEPPRGLDGELLANRQSYAEPPHPKI